MKVEIRNRICFISVDREEHLNAINLNVLSDLKSILAEYEKSKEIRSLILTGEGKKAFIAGADIKAMSSMSPKEAYNFSKLGNDITLLMDNYPKPIIAAINGYALGGGCEIAMACHIRLASENALFGQPESGLGLIPGFGGTQRLPRIVGLSNAYKILLSGAMIKAEEAKRIGLVTDIFKQEDLMNEAISIANKINSKSPGSSSKIIQLVNKGISLDLKDALSLESTYFEEIFKDENKDIGIKAFLNKEKPNFKD